MARSICKFALFFVAFLSFLSETQAQASWTSSGNRWTYTIVGRFSIRAPFSVFVDRDTVVNGIPSRILADESGHPNGIPFDTENIVYEEGDSLFHLSDGEFHLLYDFSLEIGDTMKVYIAEIDRTLRPGEGEFAFYRVDSLETVEIDGEEFRAQFLTALPIGLSTDALTFAGWRIEYIGAVDAFFFPYNFFLCDGACPLGLRCFTDGRKLEFKRVDFPCEEIINSTREPDISSQVRLFPNPVSSGRSITVTLDQALSYREVEVKLYDATGRQLSIAVDQVQARLAIRPDSALSPGAYFLVIRTPEGRSGQRIIVTP